MSDFHAANLHKKIDHIMDVFFGAGVASHPTIIEQINYLLFMRALSQKDDDLRNIGVNDSGQIVFDGELEKYRWDNLLTLNAEQLFIALEECFRKIPESTTNKTVRLVFRNAHIKLFDKPTLRTVLHEIDVFAKLMDESEHQGKRDIFGDTYEYLLSKLAQAGTSGQFRTPRHIIEFLVDVVAPKKGETILDPAVGTAGFLVKAFEYLRREYTSPEQLNSGGAFDKLSSKEHTFLYEHSFSGFDSDEDMIKFGMMNLYLHGLQNARMLRQNTLTDTAGSRDRYDVILANPPFAGKVDRDSVAEELQMNTGATEILFLRYILRHLTDSGRAGVIVPEGVLFNTSGAHIKIRELLLDNGLWCIASLPAGVFNPYAGVKTSILFFDKTMKTRSEVLFAKVVHDGYSLGAQRRPTTANDIPEVLADIERFLRGEELQQKNAHSVSFERIKETKDFNLSGDRYKLISAVNATNYKVVKLGDVSKYIRGATFSRKDHSDDHDAVLVATTKAAQADGLHFNDLVPVSPSIIKKDEKFLQEGDLLISIANSASLLGRKTFVNKLPQGKRLSFGTFMGLVRPNAEYILPEFLYQFLELPEYKEFCLAHANTTTNISNLNWSDLSQYEIPLPPIEIQQKIVAEIKEKQKAIDNAKEAISTLEMEKNLILINSITRPTRDS